MAETVEITPKGDIYTGSGHLPFRAGETLRVSPNLAGELKKLGQTIEPEPQDKPAE